MSVYLSIPAAVTWTADQEAANGYKTDDCVWNLASNELQAEGKGAQNDPHDVQAQVNELVGDYNSALRAGKVPHGTLIINPGRVTVSQLTYMESLDPPKPATTSSASPTAATPSPKAVTSPATPTEAPFVGPLPVSTSGPMAFGNISPILGEPSFGSPLPITNRPMVYESGPKKGQIVPGSGE
jgi:hypothetical protein